MPSLICVPDQPVSSKRKLDPSDKENTDAEHVRKKRAPGRRIFALSQQLDSPDNEAPTINSLAAYSALRTLFAVDGDLLEDIKRCQQDLDQKIEQLLTQARRLDELQPQEQETAESGNFGINVEAASKCPESNGALVVGSIANSSNVREERLEEGNHDSPNEKGLQLEPPLSSAQGAESSSDESNEQMEDPDQDTVNSSASQEPSAPDDSAIQPEP